MINFEKYTLENGLTVILHEDKSSPLVAVNILYKVGSKNEHEAHTGFAHLFEHLMFTGSKNVPDFDIPIQMSGGENNAFTNSDITNYYDIIPWENLDTALWIEADRMANLTLDQEKLDIQKKVVIEEFYETCLNQPYGDLWHHLSKMAYKTHPYRWPTIGIEPSHIEKITINEARNFYNKYYVTSNAILVLSGNIDVIETKNKVEKYFGHIASKPLKKDLIPEEIDLKKHKEVHVQSDVPLNVMYMAFLMPDRNHPDFYIIDLITDILASGRSSRFYTQLFKKENMFNHIDAYVTGTDDKGLFIVDAKLQKDVSYDTCKKVIWNQLNIIATELVSDKELQKVKNKLVSNISYNEVSVLNKAINLAYYESIGDAGLINKQKDIYEAITANQIRDCASNLLTLENCSILTYGS